MKREIFVCDRCKASAETKEEKEELGLGKLCLGFDVSHYAYSTPTVYTGHQIWSKEWCRKCRKELGILEEELRKEDAPEPPSLEDMVREIVQSENDTFCN